MRPEILALFIPIIFVVGLFTAISLHIYYKYKARVATADHAPGESLAEWYEAEAMAKAAVSRSAALRLGAFLTGIGIGTILGIFAGRSPGVWQFFGSFYEFHDADAQLAAQISVWVLFIMACAFLMGGICMVCAYFLERALDGKNKQKSNI